MIDDSYSLGGAKHYDSAYSVKEDLVDRDFYLDLANEYGGPVLEFGCGTGRITLPLARQGVDVTTMQPLIRDGHVQSNCDLVAIGAPKWPCTWRDGLHVAMMLPSTSGEILCFLAEPGNLPFKRVMRRRPMQWMVAEVA